ncbi:hypothetical protein [Halomarina oriensis]|uniref:DUF3368 domain-containing protein n=1 Tax=Halomarina oriensis TaxID=671145 RepID=A0A6B0GIM3_9EURY|nr:hypothetical protein [Halomarina oriensis]MWG33717.1 hypothetical protein [Halomarina oriensis]
MSERVARPVVLDATVLSNYASTDSVSWLTTTLDELWTVPAVQGELERGVARDYRYLSHALDALASGAITVDETAEKRLEQDHPSVRAKLDRGEAEAFVAAQAAGGTLATDDAAARRLAGEFEVPVTGSIGLLIRGIAHGELSVETADAWLQTWITERNYYSPVDSIGAALPDDLEE